MAIRKMPQTITCKRCFAKNEDVIATIYLSKPAGSGRVYKSYQCHESRFCEKRSICHILQAKMGDKLRYDYIKCCHICGNAPYCKHKKAGKYIGF